MRTGPVQTDRQTLDGGARRIAAESGCIEIQTLALWIDALKPLASALLYHQALLPLSIL
jgi:hypothetical protein